MSRGLATVPTLRLTGPVFTEEATRIRNQDPVRLFLMMARDLTVEPSTDHELQLKHNATDWAARGISSQVISPHQIMRFSTAAHTACLRMVIDRLSDNTLPRLMVALGAWHSSFYQLGHDRAYELLRNAPGLPLQRPGDNWRNWLLDSALVDGGRPDQLVREAPERLLLLTVRSSPELVRKMLSNVARPPWWWTVYQPVPAKVVVLADAATAPADWVDATMGCLAIEEAVEAAAVAHDCHRDELVPAVRFTIDLSDSVTPRPFRPGTAFRGQRLAVVEALWHSEDVRERLVAMVDRLDRNGAGLRETMSAFLRFDLNLARAAESLGVHRSTLKYRLDRISKDSGVDPRTVDGAAVWWGALTMSALGKPS